MAVAVSVEVERKYDVPAQADVPDLAGLPGVDAVTEVEEHALEATYYDTPDLRLRAAAITLRSRSGGVDAGWHLKLPAGADREELTLPPAPGPVPEQLQALVRARVRRSELAPVARLSTRRRVRRLLDASGRALAEVADDAVTGRPLPAGDELVWREWEVELLAGERELLDVVEQRLLAAGARHAESASKLGRVLRWRPAVDGQPPWWAETGRPGRPGSAGAVVQGHLAEQVAELLTRDPQARRDLPDAVHKMRVATRRLRSALSTWRPLLDREQTDPLRGELRHLAAVLGGVRDAEVMHARLRRLVAAEPAELVLGPVQRRIDTVLSARHRAAHERLVAELDGDRYLRLLDALEELVAAPPFRDRARGRPKDVLPRLVGRAWVRLDRTMTATDRAADAAERVALLHEVRKDAKRVRYAAEAVEPVFGRPARRFAAALELAQESLGDLQDGVVTSAALRELGAAGHGKGENGFTFGRLHALEQARAQAAVERWPDARQALSRRRLRRWFEG